MPAWVESDSEVLEEVWASEVVEVLGFEKEKDSKAIEGHLDEASQKKETDEHMIKMFCVTSPEGPKNETQHHVNVQKEPKSKRKVPLVLFICSEESVAMVRRKQRKRAQPQQLIDDNDEADAIQRYKKVLQYLEQGITKTLAYHKCGVGRKTIVDTAAIAELEACDAEAYKTLREKFHRGQKLSEFANQCKEMCTKEPL
ncbi:coiled-coil domain-containing protein 106-like [Labeo rohita]|uniref:Coiled-coil domain-containing protein 106-like n=1 Tax=Labeo rohita TaxID=84645 RepID=A0A498LXY9_LABRO|nr:coiled-coil domain-containing protein 106-like [Labeo rohita]RXN33582.1 coiled-coil domain-containing protein 106-like [Labeo rohita]